MDIRAWERRASAFERPYPGYADEDEGYYEDSGELLSPEDYEEMLFQRVLDKIRIARAAGNEDVQLSTEELDAYQSKLHGARTPAARPQPEPRPTDSSMNDNASAASVPTKHTHSSSRSKKEKQRTSMFSSKSKKDRDKDKSGHRKRVSTSSSVASPPLSQTSPGFLIPGPDGHPVFAPINAYQGHPSRDQLPSSRDQSISCPTSRSTSGTQQPQPVPRKTPPRDQPPPRDVLGAFPGSEHTYRPPTPTLPTQNSPQHPSLPSLSARQQAYARERQLEAQGLISATQQKARGVPFPVEMYQYQAFTPATISPTSSTQQSQQMPQQYVRRVSSAGQSEASWTSMPRRVPVPTSAPPPVPLQRSVAGVGGSAYNVFASSEGYDVDDDEVDAGDLLGMGGEQGQGLGLSTGMAMGTGKNSSRDGERRRKSGKSGKRKN
ncbi:hypothetical protein T440DRAFT_514759 [Plenodomus tracheiphilus IPT5]|uniref:Uncharacterized protein n=1 Tax=Plenodomus tracheiphilus IPT5 TaxID=1408161 RepID=A0A6A7BI14_9PLEO|nr:hypothetical protein T440DRAFT_514759 [Plenodomus tracheiphilus IPT5]